jgi:hypothetical protein
MPDGNKNAVDVDRSRGSTGRGTHAHASHAGVVAQYFIDGVIPNDAGFAGRRQCEQAVLQYFLGTQFIATMYESDMRCDIAEVQSFFDRRIAAANDGNRFAAIEKSIAGGAGRDALAAKGFLGRQAQILSRGAGGDDQRIASVFAVIAGEAEGAVAQIDFVDMVKDDLRLESLRVGPHALHERRSLQVFDIARPIIDVGGGHELSALLQAGDEQWISIRSRRIDGRGVACRS